MREIYEAKIEFEIDSGKKIREELDPYEPWTDADTEAWQDYREKERVYWADQFDLAYERELAKDSWMVAILELHRNQRGKCEGCDIEGMECEPPEWPCRTVYLATEHHTDFEFPRPERKRKKKPVQKGYVTYEIHKRRD